MNYIAEIKAFYDLLETNQMSTSTIALWHALMHIANKTMWQSSFAVAMRVLEIKTGLKKQAIYDARKSLKNLGLINFEPRDGNQSAIYTMYSFVSDKRTQEHTQCDTQTQSQAHTQTQSQTHTINKLNETKKEVSKKDKPTPVEQKRPKNNYENQINGFTDDEGLRTALWGYIQMRVNKRSAPTDHALELVLKHLMELSTDKNVQIAILNKSTTNNWTDIYTLKDAAGNHDSPSNSIAPPKSRKKFHNFDEREFTSDHEDELRRKNHALLEQKFSGHKMDSAT